MAKYFSNPNPYSKTLDQKFNKQVIILALVLFAVSLAYMVSKDPNIFLAIGLFIITISVALYTFKNISISMGKNDRGAGAEREIRDLLISLPGNYSVFQNVLIKENLDIDFVVVGPIGVIAIEVKSHKFFRDFTRQTKAEAMALKQYLADNELRTYVGAVLVFTRAGVRFGNKPQFGVYVINKKWLLPMLENAVRKPYNQAKAEDLVQKLYETHIG